MEDGEREKRQTKVKSSRRKKRGRQKKNEMKIRKAASRLHYEREDETDTHLVRGLQCTCCYGATTTASQTSDSQVCLVLVKVN